MGASGRGMIYRKWREWEERKHTRTRGRGSGITIWKVVQDMGGVTFGELQNITVGLCPHHTSTWNIMDEVHLQETQRILLHMYTPHLTSYEHSTCREDIASLLHI